MKLIDQTRKELEDKVKFKEAHLTAHFNKCKKCKPDDYCNMYMILHHQWIKYHDKLEGFNLGVSLGKEEGKKEAQKEFLDKIEDKLNKWRALNMQYSTAVCNIVLRELEELKQSLEVKE